MAEWYALPEDDRLSWLSEYMVTHEMAAYEQHLLDRKLQREKAKGN